MLANKKDRKVEYICNCMDLILKRANNMNDKALEELYLQLVGIQLKASLSSCKIQVQKETM